MGIDLLDITFRIEKAFGIDVPHEELFARSRNHDIVVGDLYELVLEKLHLRDLGRHSVRVNEYLWLQMQSVLHSAAETPLEQIEFGLELKTLFPRETRRDRWEALRDVCPYRISDLDYPKLVRFAGFLLAAGVAAIELFQAWQIPGARWFWPFLGMFAIWMVSETYLKLLSVFAPLRTCFPSGMATVKDLCRTVLATNYAEICDGSQILLDERCSAVWGQLVEILAKSLGVDPAEVTFRSRLFGDLGAA